jgi:hypothetical protein
MAIRRKHLGKRSILRQVALVAYGTRFLRDGNTLEDWHRHHILADVRFQFRAFADNTLLAEDFTWWLGILKLSCATRLSLHLATEFQLHLPHVWRGGDYAIVVHYADRHEIWAVGEEHARWLEHPRFTEAAHEALLNLPDAARYSNEIDSYWYTDSRPGVLDVAETDWKKLAASIGADLGIAVPSSLVPAGPFIFPVRSPHEGLPLFPFTREVAKAHHLAATLNREQSSFSHDMNPKNENTFNERMDPKVHQWGERLDSWMIEVLLRCANDTGGASGADKTFQARVYTSAPEQTLPLPPETTQTIAPPASEQDADSLRPAGSRWTNRFVLFFMIAVFTVFFVALANVIVAWPWLGILLGLPYALYVNARR